MDRFLSPPMPSRSQRARSERRHLEPKMAAAVHEGQTRSTAEKAVMTQKHKGGKGDAASPALPILAQAPDCTDMLTPSLLVPDPAPQHSMSADTPITYIDVVRAVKDAMAPMMEAQANSLQRALQDIKSQFRQLSNQVTANEHRLGETFQDVHIIKEKYETLQKSHLQLSNKVDDLENRSRRCNLRLVGLPEIIKGPELFKFLQITLPSLLHIQEACSDIVIERAHRLGPTRSEPEARPRVVIFKMLSFLHKEAIWQASRKQRDIRWNNNRIFIFQDYSAEVTRARKEFSVLCSRLASENKKFALLFPARLRIYDGTSFKEFSSPADAEGFLREMQEAAGHTSPSADLPDQP